MELYEDSSNDTQLDADQLVIGKTNVSNVNIREESKKDSKRVEKIVKKVTIVVILDLVNEGNEVTWYYIRVDEGTTAFVMANLVDIIDTDEFIKSLK